MSRPLALAAGLMAALALPALAGRDLPGARREARAAKDEKPRPRPAWEAPDALVTLPAAPEALAIVGADIHPVVGPVIPSGILLLRDGRIEAVLRSGARIPDGHRVVDAHGLQAWPGYVAIGADGLGLADDAWLGGQEAILARGIGESFDAWSDQVELAASAGITTALTWRTASDARALLAGRASILKMSAREPRAVLVDDAAAAVVGAGILSPDGRTRLRRTIETWRESPPRIDPDKPDRQAELWRRVARGEAPLLATFDGAPEILSLVEIADELDLRVLLVSPSEAWPIAERLAASRVAVAQNVRHSWGKPRDDRRGNLEGGWRFDAVTRLTRAGVPTAVVPDSHTIALWGVAGRDLLDLPLEAAFAVRAGLSEREAIEAVTIGAARILGIDDRVGSLQAGKDADVILLDGDPLDYRTLVRTTIVNGRIVHEAGRSRFWHGIARRRGEALRDGRQSP